MFSHTGHQEDRPSRLVFLRTTRKLHSGPQPLSPKAERSPDHPQPAASACATSSLMIPLRSEDSTRVKPHAILVTHEPRWTHDLRQHAPQHLDRRLLSHLRTPSLNSCSKPKQVFTDDLGKKHPFKIERRAGREISNHD